MFFILVIMNSSTSNTQVVKFLIQNQLYQTLMTTCTSVCMNVTVLCVFKFHRLLGYFNQEIIVVDVLMCSIHAESKTNTQTQV